MATKTNGDPSMLRIPTNLIDVTENAKTIPTTNESVPSIEVGTKVFVQSGKKYQLS